jgi:dihydroflavonol-4-reductase
MDKLFLITGASGHVGTALTYELLSRGYEVRGLLYYSDHPNPSLLKEERVKYFRGDIGEKTSLKDFFADLAGKEVYLIHLAALIDIKAKTLTPRIEKTNVVGLKNVYDLAQENHIKRFVYISSVDAFETAKRHVDETSPLAPTNKPIGAYPISKSLVTSFLKEKQKEGANVAIVYPSAVIGPYDKGQNHMVQMIMDYCDGKIPGVVKGFYDVVDVRDLAKGITDCALLEKRPSDDSYILSGQAVPIKEILSWVRRIRGHGRPILVFPYFLAYVGLPFVDLYCRIHHHRPLYTSFALHLLKNANTFSHEKASRELGYAPRSIEETIRDTLSYLYDSGAKE